ncbi:hypothetical protein DRH29_01575 [candidate division Kazan bacterium]|uniref:GIY-YIG domain-containing protein n=1 Tax=candidate division Kazan bacterium TaxID=2202143 RepID=A0A420ZD62_UNCK3|nr:MAG: hypothetical protein DRH29_01575 [candidate division Kazan bacterium]
MQNHNYYIYIMTNHRNSVLYTGITNNLIKRVYEHKHKLVPGFTAKYNICKLAYFEQTENVESAILREKQIKGWRRSKKEVLINLMNPKWQDLSQEWNIQETDSSTEPMSLCHSERSETKPKNLIKQIPRVPRDDKRDTRDDKKDTRNDSVNK